jgi:DNA-binding PadR family transcriptional regulator
MGIKREFNGTRDSEKRELIIDVLKKILPKREQWVLEVIRIIAESSPITSYSITKKLNKVGFNTRVSSVHPFLDRLIEAGLCSRKGWEETGYKAVKIMDKGMNLYYALISPVDNSFLNNQ